MSGQSVAPVDRASRAIELNGVVLGSAIAHELGVRFVAADDRVGDMDQSIWPNADHAFHSARQMFKSGARSRSVSRR